MTVCRQFVTHGGFKSIRECEVLLDDCWEVTDVELRRRMSGLRPHQTVSCT